MSAAGHRSQLVVDELLPPTSRLGPLGAGPARDTHDADEMVRSRLQAERALQPRHRSELMTLAGPLHVAFRWRHA
jgi:hypothetical protein